MKKVISFIVVLCLIIGIIPLPIFAASEPLTYKESGSIKRASVISCDKNYTGDVEIPHFTESYCAVIEIGSGAFSGCNIKSVYIPASVMNIAVDAFDANSDIVIKCSKYSEAYAYALEKNMTYDLIVDDTDSIIYLDDVSPIAGDRYTGNQGDSVLAPYNAASSISSVSGKTYTKGLAAWIARWNFGDKKSWVWNEYNINNEFKQLTGYIDVNKNMPIAKSYDTTVQFVGDGVVLEEYNVTNTSQYPISIDVDVSNVGVLKVYVFDNLETARGTEFILGDCSLHRGKDSDDNLNNETATSRAFIDAHINFIQNKYAEFYKINGFNNAYWQFDEGENLITYRIWNAVGDVGKVMTLDIGGLSINADYYDLFISEYLLRMTESKNYDIDNSAIENYTKAYKEVTGGLGPTLLTIIEEDELIIADLEDIAKNADKSLEEILHWKDADLFNKNIEKIISGESHDLDPTAKVMYNKIFSKYLNDEYYAEKLFSGAKKINTFASLINDGVEAFEKITNAYIVAQACTNVNEEIFNVLNLTWYYMKDINAVYATWFKEDLDKYYAIATDEEALTEYIFTEFVLANGELIWDNSQLKEVLTELTQRTISIHFNIGLPQLKALIATYNGTYKLLDVAFQLSNKGDEYLFMNYIVPLEKAMAIATDIIYGNRLLVNQTFDNAIKYDYAYKCLKETNIYLYESLYKYAALFQKGLTTGTVSSSAQDLMDLATYIKNDWVNTSCHDNVIANRYKYTAVQCPVDVYVYDASGNLLVAIENEEITTYNDTSITIMKCDGKKSIMYPADSNYSIKIVARDSGTMQYYVTEVEGTTEVRCVEFYDLPLVEGQIYTGEIPGEFDVHSDDYKLITNGIPVLSDYDSNNDESCHDGHSFDSWHQGSSNYYIRECSICHKKEIQVHLSTPNNLNWDSEKQGVVAWNAVDNALYYKIQLYKNNTALGGAIIVDSSKTQYDLLTNIESEGNYAFTIQAIGDNIYFFDSNISENSSQYHVHNWATEYNNDANNHWYECSCCDETKDEAPHNYDGATDADCNICGYVRTLTHTHDWSNIYSKDANNHWYECSGCDEIKDEEHHNYDGATDADCNACGYVRTLAHTHDWSNIYSKDATNHWYNCSGCDEVKGEAHHEWGEGVETTPATTTQPGIMTYTCICGQIKTEAIPSTESNYDEDFWYLYIMMIQNRKFNITASTNEGGTISPAGISKVKYDKDITYTITPDDGYTITDVLVDGKSVGTVSEYTFENVKEAHTIIVVFKELAWENPFGDIDEDDWFYEDIEYAYENGLMIGTSDDSFSPTEIVNRAMLVTVLWRLEGSPIVESSVNFVDVSSGEWYTDAVNWAAVNGIVNGYGDGIFGGTNDLTYEQVMAILNRYAVYKKLSENVSGNADDAYINSEWAENNVLWADINGLFDGFGSDISDLTKGATRAELAAYLRRFCKMFITE